jgi:hypothetical protein
MNDDLRGLFFESYPGQMLSVPFDTNNVTQKTTKVADKMDCLFACIATPWCRSVNFKVTSESDGLQVCELIYVDKFTGSIHVKQDGNIIYMSIKASKQS